MATFNEMSSAIILLVINTAALIAVVYGAGPVLDYLSVWFSGQAAGPISGSAVQNVFPLFYWMIIALEIVLFVNLFIVAIRRTNYQTGEADF